MLVLGLPMCTAAFDWLSDLQTIAPGNQGIILTQLPREARIFGEGGRIVRLDGNGALRVLTGAFHSAADPEVSFDGEHILFAAKRAAGERWQIFEMAADGSNARQITKEDADCRTPIYQSKIYNIMINDPWRQVAFARQDGAKSDLYSAKLDGTLLRRLTYNLARSVEPAMMPDGRVLFAAHMRGRSALYGVNLDGTDYAIYSTHEGGTAKRSPAATAGRLVVFVESKPDAWDGAGALAAVSQRRSFKSYRVLTQPAAGLFAWPAAMPNGEVLVSRRPAANGGTHGIVRFDPETGKTAPVFDTPEWHEVQAKVLVERAEPDGRASVVDEEEATGKLYALDVYTTDEPGMKPGMARRVRLLDGSGPVPGARILGETDISDDGSFHLEVPANIPLKVQLLDADGLALRTSDWIWVKNKENRGCIGCHEDRDLVPENRLADALNRPAAKLTLPEKLRHTVDYAAEIQPILAKSCMNGSCHSAAALRRYVRPGEARNSPMIWSLYGRRTSRPWDRPAANAKVKMMPPAGHSKLTDEQKRLIAEWIDTGARNGKEQGDESKLAGGAGGRVAVGGGAGASAGLHRNLEAGRR